MINSLFARLGAIAVFAAALSAGASSPALAQHEASAQVDAPAAAGPVVSPAEAADQKVLDEALQAVSQGGFSALESHVPALRDALGRAPAAYPMVERKGDTITIRAIRDEDFSLLSLTALTAAADPKAQATSAGGNVDVVRGEDTYPSIAFLLGSYFNEVQRPQEAIAYLDRGLAMQPNAGLLIGEKVAALQMLHRLDELVALCDQAIASSDMALVSYRARFLRNRGVALIDLNRLDEAETSLKDSIKADPKDKYGVDRSRHELDYLAKLRKGGPTAPTVIQTRAQGEAADKKAH